MLVYGYRMGPGVWLGLVYSAIEPLSGECKQMLQH